MDRGPFWLWILLVLVQLYGCFGCWKEERIALLHIKSFFNNPSGSSLPSWDIGKESDCCNWENIECNITSGRVIKLSLYENTFDRYSFRYRYINASLFLPFEELRSLDLSDKGLAGCVVNEGFDRLSTLNKLEALDLSGNNFNNSILSSLGTISSLKTLLLVGNNFDGSSHIEGLNSLSKIQVLNLDWNSFNQTILRSLSGLSSLKKLYLAGNMFDGSINIQDLDGFINLEVLVLSVNYFKWSFSQNLSDFDGLGNLKVLDLSHSQLNGTLQGLCKLKNLQDLYLNHNRFDGSLPSCLRNLTSLRLLDLSYNNFHGNIASSPIANLPSLEYLDLSFNRFQSSVSFSFLANHSKLEVFNSDGIELVVDTDSPTWVPTFQLKILTLSNCTFNKPSGVIPNFLYSQYDLRVVDLSHNNLVGKFPFWLMENNKRLERLFLSNNAFIGPFHLPFQPNVNLNILDVSNNQFSGEVSMNISLLLPNLRMLVMSGNAFEGSIPSSLSDMSQLLYLDLSSNFLSGGVSEFFAKNSSSIETLKLSNNCLHDQIFPTFTMSELRDLYLDGNNFTTIPNSFSNSTYLTLLEISNNNISGRVPLWIGNLTFLETLVMSSNNFEGPIPDGFRQLESLEILDLSDNQLSGPIPSCFNSTIIKHVRLQINGFTGPLPFSKSSSLRLQVNGFKLPLPYAFPESSSLITLDVSHNQLTDRIPKWLGGLTELGILILKGNHFQGTIPIQLCQLKQISIMDLSHNNLSGPIPSCLNNLTLPDAYPRYVITQDIFGVGQSYSYINHPLFAPSPPSHYSSEYTGIDVQQQVEFTTKTISYPYKGKILEFMSGIDFSCNHLTGSIPSEIGDLSKIRALNLSHNHLTGPIPITFSNLREIESLDLSYNNLSGTIPSQLTMLNSLAVFTVSHNNLSGKTPERNAQFITFTASSYEGNPFLCGPPLEKNCTTNVAPSSKPTNLIRQQEDNGSINMDIFKVSFATTYITVLLVLVAILYINPYWRKAWFHLIDVGITSCYYFVLDHLP